MAIDSVNGAGGSSPGNAVSKGKDPMLDQNTFLTLMVAQMKNQDPLKPANPTEFLGQLAQFSTVTSVQGMQESIASLSDSLRTSQVMNGTSLVGRDVLAVAEEAALTETGSVKGSVAVPDVATSAELVITDSAGQLVKRVPLTVNDGQASFTWDGTTTLGTRAPADTYQIAAYASIGGANYQLETEVASRVSSVTIDPYTQSLTLNTDSGPVALADVRRVM